MTEPITITSPSVGANLQTGSATNITWTSDGSCGNDLDIHLFRNYMWLMTVAQVTDTRSYSWNIPTSLLDGTDYQLKIERRGDYSCGNWDTWGRKFGITSSTPPPTPPPPTPPPPTPPPPTPPPPSQPPIDYYKRIAMIVLIIVVLYFISKGKI